MATSTAPVSKLTQAQHSALSDLHLLGALYPRRERYGRGDYAARTLQSLVCAGHARWYTGGSEPSRDADGVVHDFVVPV